MWNCLFVLPEWVKAWWSEFRDDAALDILSVTQQKEVLGLAPLQIKGHTASFIGDVNVCDYFDFIVNAGKEALFCDALLDHLSRQGIRFLELGPVRPASSVLLNLVKVAENRGCKVSIRPEDVALELDLAGTWEDYLGQLNGKQRHEVKRKFRRLHEAGDVEFRIIVDAGEIPDRLATFFELFRLSSEEKAAFMTDQMMSFFRALAIVMAEAHQLKLYLLELNTAPVAVSLCFDFNDTIHLYNSGFDPRYRALSVGLLCKVLTIKDAIQRGRRKYDFLKGAEIYKYRLGGREVPLSNCRIEL